jgi:chorismate mutase/prephenate dehydratase
MTKKRPTRSPKTPEQWNRELNKVDRQIVKLAQDRAKAYKKWLASSGNESTWDSQCEADQLESAVSRSKGPLDDEAVRSIIRELVSGCRRLSRPRRICFLGPAYSYSHLAAIRKFGENNSMVPVGTIKAVFEEVNRGTSDLGLVPIENSTDGRIVDTLDMLARLPVKICGEVQLRIHHNLLARCERKDVAEVYSKPQALSQCRDWLSQHLPNVRLVEMTSTAQAAQLAAEKPAAAAIASAQAATRYGLQILADSIEDNRHNVTRFAVIGDAAQKRTGQDKTSMMFEISHRPGSLADIMNVFKRCSLNLTWIESFPMPGTKNEYQFFVECEGHTADVKVKRALTSLEKKTVRLDVLGSYPRTEPEDA